MPDRIEQLVVTVGQQLKKREWKLVTAESCTGGGLSYGITSVAGSSAWFERGFITYSNLAKEELLGVTFATLSAFGSVSSPTVREMAEGALQHSEAQVSVAITGIAGPDGGTVQKPVGTVWIGCAGIHVETKSSLMVFSGDRQSIREQAIIAALEQLLGFL